MSGRKKLERLLITTPDELVRLAGRLREEPILAVDTEANSLHAYREQVCLVQFSTTRMDYLVDPLALEDLSALGAVFADRRVEKVFHAAEYDLLGLNRDFGFEFANLFDTMVAARILGREEFGLGALLEAEFGITLDKRHQRADWGQRPLPGALLSYARLDTHYLIPLRDRLDAELRERGLLKLALEDFAHLIAFRNEHNGRQPAEERPVDCWRVSGAHDLEPRQAAVLMELCRYRDQAARAMDRPLFKVINDATLLAIAAEPPENLPDLGRAPGMTQTQIRRHGEHLLQAVQRGLDAPPLHPPRQVRPDARYLARVEALRNWRKKAAQHMGVSSDVVLPRDLMLALAAENPHTPAALAQALEAFPWRLEHFGGQILDVLLRCKG